MEIIEHQNGSVLLGVKFKSKDATIQALLRIPDATGSSPGEHRLPAVVLLPGATVSKEREQGLAKLLGLLGYASITLDQRNLGVIDFQGDWQMFSRGEEPIEYKMVYDALLASQILRSLNDIDPERIIYMGESNGGRFAAIACALDAKAQGVIGISTCGLDTKEAVTSGKLKGQELGRFAKSIDPDSYLDKIAPRPLVLIHSRNDTVIPYECAEQTYAQASPPKSLWTVGCAKHGYCTDMAPYIEEELGKMAA